MPCVFRVGQNDRYELGQTIFFRRTAARLSGRFRVSTWLYARVKDNRRIDAKIQGDENQQQRANPTSGHAARHPGAAPIFNVVAPATLLPAHGTPP
jgi:hypothetical protein